MHTPSGFDYTLRLHGFNRHLRFLNGLQSLLFVKAFGSFACDYDFNFHKLKNLLSNLNSSIQHEQLQEWCLSFVSDVQVNITNILAVIGGLNERQTCISQTIGAHASYFPAPTHFTF